MAQVSPAQDVLSKGFREVFDAEFAFVCRTLRRLGVREADLADVAQELFVSVHRSLADYDGTRPLRPWLFSFCARFAANYRRLARHRSVELAENELSVTSASDVEARDLVLRALGHLEFDRRVVLVMHDMEGFAAPEIAEQVAAPLNTVYSRLRLARADFRAAVKTLQGKEGT